VLRALIVDDEQLARRQLRRFLGEVPGVVVVGECESGEEAVPAIMEGSPDAVFLDVQMPVLDGFGVIEAVGPDRMPPVIFVTAYEEHALRAFRARALHYLLKPVDPKEVAEAVRRLPQPGQAPGYDAGRALAALLQERAAAERYLRRFVVRCDGRISAVPVERVDWIEAADNDVILHAGAETHRLRSTLASLALRLDPARFARIHRSAIVRLEGVREVQPWFHGESVLFLQDNTRLTIGRTYRESFLLALGG
jgi:two-component system LytT family response regulator